MKNSLLLFAPWNIMKWKREVIVMGYMTANQAAKKWNISQRRVQILCSEGRIKGTFKLGEAWAIPEDAPKPEDNRKARKQDEK